MILVILCNIGKKYFGEIHCTHSRICGPPTKAYDHFNQGKVLWQKFLIFEMWQYFDGQKNSGKIPPDCQSWWQLGEDAGSPPCDLNNWMEMKSTTPLEKGRTQRITKTTTTTKERSTTPSQPEKAFSPRTAGGGSAIVGAWLHGSRKWLNIGDW